LHRASRRHCYAALRYSHLSAASSPRKWSPQVAFRRRHSSGKTLHLRTTSLFRSILNTSSGALRPNPDSRGVPGAGARPAGVRGSAHPAIPCRFSRRRQVLPASCIPIPTTACQAAPRRADVAMSKHLSSFHLCLGQLGPKGLNLGRPAVAAPANRSRGHCASLAAMRGGLSAFSNGEGSTAAMSSIPSAASWPRSPDLTVIEMETLSDGDRVPRPQRHTGVEPALIRHRHCRCA